MAASATSHAFFCVIYSFITNTPLNILSKFLSVWSGFYAVSNVFLLFNGYSSQMHVSWTIFHKFLTGPFFWHRWLSRSAIPIILSAKDFQSHWLLSHISHIAIV